MDMLIVGVVWYVVLIFSITCHEAAHALAALRLGDPTAYYGGQVTLDPIPHIRRAPFGMIVIPIVSFIFLNYMLGMASVPYDPQWADRYPRRAAWMALAGPAANLLIILIAAGLIHLGLWAGFFKHPAVPYYRQVVLAAGEGFSENVALLVSILFSLNLILFVFNLLPLPPLDGSGALPLLIGQDAARRYQGFMQDPMFSLVGLFIAWKIFGIIFYPVFRLAIKLLYPGMGYH